VSGFGKRATRTRVRAAPNPRSSENHVVRFRIEHSGELRHRQNLF
jgi:hypothetical protein